MSTRHKYSGSSYKSNPYSQIRSYSTSNGYSSSKKYSSSIYKVFNKYYETETNNRRIVLNSIREARNRTSLSTQITRDVTNWHKMNTNLKSTDLQKLIQELQSDKYPHISYKFVNIRSPSSPDASEIRNKLTTFVLESLEQCMQDENHTNYHFIRNYLKIVKLIASLIVGNISTQEIITQDLTTVYKTSARNFVERKEICPQSSHTTHSTHHCNKTANEIMENRVIESLTTNRVLTDRIRYSNDNPSIRDFFESEITPLTNIANNHRSKYLSTFNLFYPCQLEPKNSPELAKPNCEKSDEAIKNFVQSFLTQYLTYIQRMERLNSDYMRQIKQHIQTRRTNRTQRGGNLYNYVSNNEWLAPANATHPNAIHLTKNTISNDPDNISTSLTQKNISNVDVLLGLDSTTNREAYKKHTDTKAVTSLLSSDTFLAKDLIEKRYTLQEELDNLESNFYSTFNLQQLQDAVSLNVSTTQFRYETKNLDRPSTKDYKSASKQAEQIYDSIKTHSKIVEYNKESVIASLRSIRGWKYMDLSKHAIGSMNDILILTFNLLTNKFPASNKTNGITFMQDILRPYLTKVYTMKAPSNSNKQSAYTTLQNKLQFIARNIKPFKIPPNSIISDEFFDLTNSNTLQPYKKDNTSETILKRIRDIFNTPKEYTNDQGVEFLIMVIYLLFQSTEKALEVMIEQIPSSHSQIKKSMTESKKQFSLIYKSGIKNYFGIENSPAKYGIDKGTLKTEASLDPSSPTYRIIGSIKNVKRKDRLQPETYPIRFTGTLENPELDAVPTIKALAAILEASDTDLYIGGPIQEPSIMKESVSMISKFVKSQIKAKKANVKRIDIIINKMKTRVHKSELTKMTKLLEITYKDIAKEKNSKLRKLQIDSALQTITTTYRSYKDTELNAIKSILTFSKMYDDQYKELTSDRRTKLNYIKEREKIVVDLLYNQLKARTYRNLATSLYKHLKNYSALDPTLNNINVNYSKGLPEAFYTLLDQSLNTIDESYNNQLNTLLSQTSSSNVSISPSSTSNMNEDTIDRFFTNANKKYLRNIDKIININAPSAPEAKNINISNLNREVGNVENVFKNISKNIRKGLTNNATTTSAPSAPSAPSRPNGTKLLANLDPNVNVNTLNLNRMGKQKRQLIASEKFWLSIRDKMKGKTVFVGYVDDDKLLSPEHGIFDLLESAIRGKIYKQFLIPGMYIDMKTLSQIYGSQYLMVTNLTRDKGNPALWQILPMRVILTMAKLTQADLRIYIYHLITSSANFNKRLSYRWDETSQTKEKILNYCRIISGYEGCPILKSRYEIASMLTL